MPEARDSKSFRNPEEWPGQFTEHLNAGDVDAVMALYAPDARIAAPSGEILDDPEKIRAMVDELIRAKARFQSDVVRAVTVNDVAQLYTDFIGTTIDPSGKTVEVQFKAVEVLRRQPDGSWLLIIGDPRGRL